ncbi:cytochrome P450 family protein [Streptomyces sp. NBC_00566]|uniref:cytochrome P450 family protein n=1 Tax=Streptomyces sp. NBC_00566 TaxID=2975778 RepID=UPI002E8171A2|nr:cytochrome P450 [Streptomyces sp. NBC_00566]WUB85482.1 cytochrome P450 [Streptomyces sp. NBC_00566]
MTDPNQNSCAPHDAYSVYAAMRAVCPVRSAPSDSGRSSYVVTGYAAAREALDDARLSKDTAAFFADKETSRRLHPAVAHNMLASDPPQHTRLRKLVTGAFTKGAVAGLRPFIADVTHMLLDQWPAGERVDFVAGLAVPLPVIVICELLGVPEADRPDVRRWSGELFAAGNPGLIDAASHSLADYMSGLIADKRQRPGDALLDRLISARDGEDHLSEEELLSLAILLLVAGHETTTNFLGNALLALLQHPAELNRLREKPEAIPAVLDELLRFDSPVSTATFRFTTEPVTLAGTEIPAGAPVLISLGAANRDPDRFPAPDELDSGRDAAAHLGFGHGIHRCVGAPLAKAEAEIALREVLKRFPRLRLAVLPDQLEWRRTRLVRGLTELPVLT